MEKETDSASSRPFLARHEFLIRRLHSLSGLIPVGAYMCVHLLTNAMVLDSPAAFQRQVDLIHTLGIMLPLVEWGFIFLPILFHAIIGVVIIRGGLPNSGSYRYVNNVRYTLQRATGMIAFLFIFWHVFHMHGWFHFDWWENSVAKPLGGANFDTVHATSTLGAAMNGFVVPFLYSIGVLSCVFHLANGIWTMGITWGVWISPPAQRRANVVCAIFGIALAALSMGALIGAVTVDEAEARKVENKMISAKVSAGVLPEASEKMAADSQVSTTTDVEK